jgi:hypothetical protein
MRSSLRAWCREARGEYQEDQAGPGTFQAECDLGYGEGTIRFRDVVGESYADIVTSEQTISLDLAHDEVDFDSDGDSITIIERDSRGSHAQKISFS